MKKGKSYSAALRVALVAMMAATLSAGKFVLSFLPNIEIVTFLLALYGYVFGWYGVAAAVVFVALEPLLYGFGSWFITYLLYWPFVALVFTILGNRRVKNRFLLAGVAVFMTLWFGVLSALVDVGLFTGYLDNFFSRFAICYARGIVFYALEVGCNAALFLALFPFVTRKLALLWEKLR